MTAEGGLAERREDVDGEVGERRPARCASSAAIARCAAAGESPGVLMYASATCANVWYGAPRADDAERLPAHTAAGVTGALWELVLQHVTGGDETLTPADLGGSAIFLALTPYLGRQVAMQYAYAPVPLRPEAASGVAAARAGNDLTLLARSTLRHLNEQPGASNAEIAAAVDVLHASQMSRHLRRLERERLVTCARRGRANAWTLTELGRELIDG